MFTGYLLTPESRAELLEIFPPKFDRVFAHHITLLYGVNADEPVPAMPSSVEVVGYILENGVEALLCSVDGRIKRPTGSKFHITWSLDKGRMPVASNRYVDDAQMLDTPIPISVIPKNFNS